MQNVVVARNYRIQALLSRFFSPEGEVLAQLRKLREFPNHRLTRHELSTSLPGWFSEDGRTLVRWPIGTFNVVILWDDPQDILVDIIEELDEWTNNDPRYETHLKTMENILVDFAKDSGFIQSAISTNDPAVELRMEALQRAYGISQWLQGKEEEYLAVVVAQGLGRDPFIRTQDHTIKPDKEFKDFLRFLPDTGYGP